MLLCHYVVKYLTLTNISPELKISSNILRNGIIRMHVFTVLQSNDEKVKIHYTVWL